MNAKDVPALAAGLQDWLLRPDYAAYAQFVLQKTQEDINEKHPKWQEIQGLLRKDAIPKDLGWDTCRELSNLLNITKLFHVTEPMASVARLAAESLPADEHWHPDSFPSLNGMLVYQTPLLVLDLWNRPINIAACMWRWESGPIPGWTLILFSQTDDLRDYYIERDQLEIHDAMRRIGPLMLFELSFLPVGNPVGPWLQSNTEFEERFRREHMDRAPEGEIPVHDPHGPPIAGNYGMINYAIFRLMDQTLAEISEETDHRLARRNRGKKRPSPMVTVIELRRRQHYGAYEQGTGRWLTYRLIVDGYWKDQPYGSRDNPSYRRIYIHPYVRGPEGAPFHQKKRVTTLRR